MYNIQLSQNISFLGIIHADNSLKVFDNKFHQTFSRMIDLNLSKQDKTFCVLKIKKSPPQNFCENLKVWIIATRHFLENVGLYAKVAKIAFFMCCLVGYVFGILKATVYFISLYKNILDCQICVFSISLYQLFSNVLRLNLKLFFVAPLTFGLFKLGLTIILIASLKLVIEDPYDFKLNLEKFLKNLSADMMYGKIISLKPHPKKNIPQFYLNQSIDGNLIDPLNMEIVPKDHMDAARYIALPNLVLNLKSVIWLYIAQHHNEQIHPIEKHRSLSLLELELCLEALTNFFSSTKEELKSISNLKLDSSFQIYFLDKFLICEKLYKLYVFYKDITLCNRNFYPIHLIDQSMLYKIKELPMDSKRILLRLMPDIAISDLI